jgi:hypothetical protein
MLYAILKNYRSQRSGRQQIDNSEICNLHSEFRNWDKKESEIYRIAFKKEKGLTDRALKLAEVGKPKSNWNCRDYWELPLLS